MKLRCNITTKQITELAKQLGENPVVTTNKVSVWQSRNNTSELPTAEDLKNLSTDLVEEEKGLTLTITPYYEGDITPAEDTIFVFGSNPEGKHGAGAAKAAREQFGAVYGVGEGITGQSYALPTKDLRVTENNGLRSIPKETIIESIKKLYKTAETMPEKTFKVAFRNGLDEVTLNGYSGSEMIEMFNAAGPIPYNIMFSKEWYDTGKINYGEHKDSTKTEEKKWKPEEVDESFGKKISIAQSAVESDSAKLSKAFKALELEDRISNVATLFSSSVEYLYQTALDELRNIIQNSKDWKEKLGAQEKLTRLEDPINGKVKFVTTCNVKDIIDNLKEGIIEMIQSSDIAFRSQDATEDQKEKAVYMRNEYQKMLDNLDLLLVQALADIEANEGIRIVLKKFEYADGKGNVREELGGFSVENSKEEETEDDENGENTSDAVPFKIREQDPHKSLTSKVKTILRNIPRLEKDSKGNNIPSVDDLGFRRTLNENYAYACILNACKDMIDAEDFHIVTDVNGEKVHRLPVLEAMRDRYPWIDSVINELVSNPDIIPQFYTCFRMDFVPAWTTAEVEGNLTFFPINRALGEENAYEAILRNYEQSNILGTSSIYEKGQNVNKKNAARNLDRVMTLKKDLANGDFDSYDELLELLKNAGIESANLETFFDLREGSESVGWKSLSKVLDNLEIIFRNVADIKDEHLIGTFEREYRKIANIVGQVTEFNRAMTFRQNGKAYPSFAVPNYATTVFKKFVSTGVNPATGISRKQEILDHYKRDKWFFRNGEWQNEWLRLIDEDQNLIETLREDGGCGLFDVSMMEGTPYPEWTPEMIKRNFIKIYFSGSENYANYHFPILSDSPIAMFVKFKKYGENYQEQILPLLRRVVLQEFYRQGKILERRQKGADKISNYDKNGDAFFFFDELNYQKSPIPYNIIKGYYTGIGTEEALKRLETLTPDENGTVMANFGDAVRAFKKQGNQVKVTETIDNALVDIMNRQFNEFKSTYSVDGESIAKFLISDGIVAEPAPAVESEAARKAREDRNTHTKYDTVDEALREFYWNDVFAQTQIIEIMTVDPAFYKFDGGIDFQKRFKEVYAAGKKLDTNSKYGRKLQRSITLCDQIITSRDYTTVKQIFDRAVQEGRITSMDRDSILYKFRNINVSDAQALRSISSMRAVLDMMGAWNSDMEASFNRITNNQWDMSDFYTIWQTLKPFVFDVVSKSDGLGGEQLIPVQNKNSEFVVLAMYSMYAASTNNSPKLKALSGFMEKNNIDVIQFESAVKAGLQSPVNINFSEAKLNQLIQTSDIAEIKKLGEDTKMSSSKKFDAVKEILDKELDKGTLTQDQYNKLFDSIEPSEQEVLDALHKATYIDGQYNDAVVTTIPYSAYSIQQPTPEHLLDTRVVFGSQFRNLIISDLPDDPNFRLEVNGKAFTKQEVLDLYDSIIVENKIDDFFTVKDKVTSIENLQSALLSIVQGNPKYSRDMENALSLVKHNGRNVFAVPLDFPTIKNQVEELILSMFKNGVTKEKIKGASCILASDIGLTKELNIRLKNGGIWDGSDNTRNLVEYAECYLPAWTGEFYNDFLVEKTSQDGTKYMELDIEKVPVELREMVGYRIPTEGKYSMIPLRVVGFLPSQNGSAIMLPADITTLAGSDFDVDKLFMMLPEFHKEGDKYVKDSYNYSEGPEEQSRASRNNAIIDIAIGVLRNKNVAENFFNPGSFDEIKLQVRRAQIIGNSFLFSKYKTEKKISSDEDALKSIRRETLDYLGDFLKKFQRKRSLLSLDTFIYNHNQNMTGKGLIGVYANNTTLQAKYQTTELALKNDYTFTINGKHIKSLHDIYTQDGHLISKNCAYFSAASVDNVKDPVLARMKQNMNTAFVTGFMLRAGMSVEEICLLFSLPDISYFIDTTGGIFFNRLTGQNKLESFLRSKFEKTYKGLYGVSLQYDNLKARVSTHQFTTEELQNAIRFDSYLHTLQPSEIKEIPIDRLRKHLENLALAEILFSRATSIATDLAGLTRISRADSPNGAIGSSSTSAPNLITANRQVLSVEKYFVTSKKANFSFEGTDGILRNSIFGDKPISEVLKALKNSNSYKALVGMLPGYDIDATIAQYINDQYTETDPVAAAPENPVGPNASQISESNEQFIGGSKESKDYWTNGQSFLPIHSATPYSYTAFYKLAGTEGYKGYTEEQLKAIKALGKYLEDNGAWRRIDSGAIDSKQPIYFSVDKTLNDDSGQFIILLTDENKNIIGNLPMEWEKNFSTFKNLDKLYSAVKDAYKKYEDDGNSGLFTFSGASTHIAKWMIGQPMYSAEFKDVKQIHTVQDSSGNVISIPFRLGIWAKAQDGRMRLVQDSERRSSQTEDSSAVKPLTVNNGQPFLLLPTGYDGTIRKYLPVPIRTKVFGDLEESTPLRKLIREQLDTFSNSNWRQIKSTLETLFAAKFSINTYDNGQLVIKMKNAKGEWVSIFSGNKSEANYDTVSPALESLHINVALKHINKTYKGADYNTLIGDAIMANLSSSHTIGNWFTINPLNEDLSEGKAISPKTKESPKPETLGVNTNLKTFDYKGHRVEVDTSTWDSVVYDGKPHAAGQARTNVVLAYCQGLYTGKDMTKPYKSNWGYFNPVTDKFEQEPVKFDPNEMEAMVAMLEGESPKSTEPATTRSLEDILKDARALNSSTSKAALDALKSLPEYASLETSLQSVPKIRVKQIWDNVLDNYSASEKAFKQSNLQKMILDFNTSGTLFREVSTTYKEKWNEQQEVAWLEKVLPQLVEQDRLRIVRGCDKISMDNQSGKAWGQFKQGVITLAEGAAKGTLYHEAFHAVTQTLLTESELRVLYSEAKKTYGNLSTLTLEENLAESFRRYVQIEETPVIGNVIKIFRTLKHLVQSIRGKENYIDNLFYKINRSKLSNRTSRFSPSQVALYREAIADRIYDLSNEVKQIKETISAGIKTFTEQKAKMDKIMGYGYSSFSSMSPGEVEEWTKEQGIDLVTKVVANGPKGYSAIYNKVTTDMYRKSQEDSFELKKKEALLERLQRTQSSVEMQEASDELLREDNEDNFEVARHYAQKYQFENLDGEQKQYLQDKGISSEEFDKLSLAEKEQLFHCMYL